MLQRRRLGRTEQMVSLIGLGGNGLMRTHGMDQEAIQIVHRALDLGINYFDAARVYAGCEGYFGKALRGRRDEVFLASKSAERDAAGARRDLEVTLRALQTDHLDLWEIHDLRTMAELDRILAPDGALTAFEEARKAGKVRFIGITAHHDVLVMRKALSLYAFETCMFPLNMAEPHYQSFPAAILPLAREADMGILGMKALCGGQLRSPEPALQFALSHPVSCVLIGVDDVEQLEEDVAIARAFEPLDPDELEALAEAAEPHAMRLMYYKKKREFVFSLN